jgi:capsular polysaccharide transport system permease protein
MVDVTRRASSAAREVGAVVGVPGAVGGALKRFRAILNFWFWAIVGVPTLLAGVYYFAVASDLYMSEVKFVVHGPAKAPTSAIGAMLGGGSAAGDDTQMVREFMLSRSAAQELAQKDDLQAILSRPGSDFLSRFPGMEFWRRDFEALYQTYLDFVSVVIDQQSGIATVKVEAYRPADANRIAVALLADGDRFINDLNDHARRDALSTFEKEVMAAEARLSRVQADLTAYRVKAKMLNPTDEAKGPMALLAQLFTQEATIQAQLSDARKNAPRSPQIGLLKTRLASLDQLISEERAKITGSNDSVATAMSEYERLNLQLEMEEKLVAQAVASREQSRLEVQRQQLYLEIITQPNFPDYPLYPKRVASFATVVGSCLLCYGIAWLLIAGVREHASA